MPLGNIEIVEFRGSLESSDKKGDVSTYLMAIDGVFRRRYGRPEFGFLPRSWVKSYQVASYDVGRAHSWKEFFRKCGEMVETKRPFDRPLSTDLESQIDDAWKNGKSIYDQTKDKLDSMPRRPSQTLNEESEVEECLEELSEVTLDKSQPQQNEHEIFEEAAVLFAELLAEPTERPLSLEFEVRGYMALLSDEVKNTPTIEIPVAAAIANGLTTLLNEFKSSSNLDSDDYRHLQAAVRYFTVSEDANSDYDPGGFDDDAAVFNKIARRLGREDLVVNPATTLNL